MSTVHFGETFADVFARKPILEIELRHVSRGWKVVSTQTFPPHKGAECLFCSEQPVQLYDARDNQGLASYLVNYIAMESQGAAAKNTTINNI